MSLRVRCSASPAHDRSTNHASPAVSRRVQLGGMAALSLSQMYKPYQARAETAIDLPLPTVPTASIGGDLQISRVIKGCWQLSGAHRGDSASDRTYGQAAVEDIRQFVQAGITTLDTADHYGPSEALIGRFLAECSEEERARVQVLTKVCVFDAASMSGLDKKYMEQAVDTSLSRLGLPQVDMVQLYWNSYKFPRYTDAGLYLMDLKAAGKVKHISVTNMDTARLVKLQEAGVEVATNQVQYSLLDRRPENEMVSYCLDKGIGLLPYGVVAGGLLSDKVLGMNVDKVQLGTASLRKYAQVLFQTGGWPWLQRLLQVLGTIAKKHNTTITNVSTKWVLSRPAVPAVIIGARNANHLADHQRLFGFELDAADKGAIEEILSKGRQSTSDCYSWERGLDKW